MIQAKKVKTGNKRLNPEPKKPKHQKQDEISSHEQKRNLMSLIQVTEDVDTILEISRHEDPEIRLKAVQQLCPCRVGRDIDEFWERLCDMVEDEDEKVRYQVLHNLCDGSPPHMEGKVYAALEVFNSDPNKDIRRRAHKVLGSYLRTGKWNVL